ncbi:uncharacterized protein EI97DRAFT_451541 [Westerdykella ornata]|uniref:Uncharacterized protein n=1 Tax=Westerdykella ornata TaxID=318751 RepID=A0A6A6JFH7_WESOR|nr:uncharacterized protein EI97DRAFT_451541 [Westerdykella ornata]KAF2274748.1 hypothetical protein EI97DRAFT_451541 [Westerdykella ornata]
MAGQPGTPAIQLADQISQGFVALAGEYQLLLEQQQLLESQLTWAKQQYLDLLKRFSPSTLSQDHRVFLQELELARSEQSRVQTHWLDHISRNDDGERQERVSRIRTAQSAIQKLHAPKDSGVRIWSGPSADIDRSNVSPKSAKADMSPIEKDFTTVGMPSKLGCPFAAGSRRQSSLATPRSSMSRMSQRATRSKRPSFNDPIRAEICGNDMVSASVSIEGSAPVCPIRFLDQHAPEEVAKYFENHKHEIPRSHEICIKRFQSNAEHIEQLDRKYGNLVSMIQGLGQKHQVFLPPEPDEDGAEDGVPETEVKTDKRVHSWAEEVSASLHDVNPDSVGPTGNGAEEAREPHFDRPLKEVRVGESPSRPWGISIPAKYTDNQSSSSVGSAPTASPRSPLEANVEATETSQKPSKCPFDHRALGRMAEDKGNPHVEESASPEEPAQADQSTSNPSPPQPSGQPEYPKANPQVVPQMVFNGPVFLGYPPEQLMVILQNSNLGSMMR